MRTAPCRPPLCCMLTSSPGIAPTHCSAGVSPQPALRGGFARLVQPYPNAAVGACSQSKRWLQRHPSAEGQCAGQRSSSVRRPAQRPARPHCGARADDLRAPSTCAGRRADSVTAPEVVASGLVASESAATPEYQEALPVRPPRSFRALPRPPRHRSRRYRPHPRRPSVVGGCHC